MSDKDGPLMDAEAVAEYLGLSKDTVLRMATRRQIPYVPVGKRKRFTKEAIDAWVRARMRPSLNPDDAAPLEEPAPKRGRGRPSSVPATTWKDDMNRI